MVIKTKKILIKKVTDILHDIGMPAHIKGFYYVRDAIILVYQDITRLNHIINDVYALVAKRHCTSPELIPFLDAIRCASSSAVTPPRRCNTRCTA